jgi:tetratricopeptide (TPR) repeat protein
MQALLVKRLTEPVPRLSALRETVSPALQAVIHRVLSKAPADRPRTAAAFIAELDAAATGAPARRRPRTVTLAGFGLLALLAVAFAVNRLGRTSGTGTATPAAGVAALLARGDQLLRERTSESFAAAMTQYEAALARDSASAETLARIGYAYALFADWGWSYGGQGISALRARALALSERALASDSTSAVAWLARAYALVQVDPYRLRGASEAFERSLRIDSTSPESWYQFGQALMYLGEDSAAIHAYQRAFALDRERPMSLMSVAAILRKSGRLEEARRLIDSAVLASRTVTSPYVHVMRGVLALETGEVSLAGDEAELALQLDTSFIVPARSLLVRVRVAEGNRSAATAEMQTVLAAIDPESLSPTEALYASGALLALGRKEEMLDLLERTRPRGAQLWFYLRNPEFNPVRADPRFARIVRESDPRDASDQNPP